MKRSAAIVGLLMLPPVCDEVLAQQYPARPIRVIVAQSAGSSLDTILRVVAPRMTGTLGQQLVIDNRGGAAGIIGVELAARAAADGYTLLVGGASAMSVPKFTLRTLAFDTLRDFDPISLIVNGESVMVVNPSVPVKSVKELIALAKAQPARLNMASAGVGSTSQLAGVMFASMAGIESVHVPYKGGGPMAASVVAGESQWAIAPAAALVGLVKAGRLRALAISSRQRSPLLPELPTLDEAGVPGYEYNSWSAFFAPRGTPRAIVKSLHAAIQKALAEPAVKEFYAAQGAVPQGSASPEEFARFFRADFERIAKLVRIAGIKPE